MSVLEEVTKHAPTAHDMSALRESITRLGQDAATVTSVRRPTPHG